MTSILTDWRKLDISGILRPNKLFKGKACKKVITLELPPQKTMGSFLFSL